MVNLRTIEAEMMISAMEHAERCDKEEYAVEIFSIHHTVSNHRRKKQVERAENPCCATGKNNRRHRRKRMVNTSKNKRFPPIKKSMIINLILPF